MRWQRIERSLRKSILTIPLNDWLYVLCFMIAFQTRRRNCVCLNSKIGNLSPPELLGIHSIIGRFPLWFPVLVFKENNFSSLLLHYLSRSFDLAPLSFKVSDPLPFFTSSFPHLPSTFAPFLRLRLSAHSCFHGFSRLLLRIFVFFASTRSCTLKHLRLLFQRYVSFRTSMSPQICASVSLCLSQFLHLLL